MGEAAVNGINIFAQTSEKVLFPAKIFVLTVDSGKGFAFPTTTDVTWQGNFAFRGSIFVRYLGSNQATFTIPSTVAGRNITTIGADAFAGNTQLTRLTIPESITGVNATAFAGVNSNLSVIWYYSGRSLLTAASFHQFLTEVRIVSGTTQIRADAFRNATRLTRLTIPSTVTSVGANAFFGANSNFSITWHYNPNMSSLLVANFRQFLTAVEFLYLTTRLCRGTIGL